MMMILSQLSRGEFSGHPSSIQGGRGGGGGQIREGGSLDRCNLNGDKEHQRKMNQSWHLQDPPSQTGTMRF